MVRREVSSWANTHTVLNVHRASERCLIGVPLDLAGCVEHLNEKRLDRIFHSAHPNVVALAAHDPKGLGERAAGLQGALGQVGTGRRFPPSLPVVTEGS